jgi:hypothetical protein
LFVKGGWFESLSDKSAEKHRDRSKDIGVVIGNNRSFKQLILIVSWFGPFVIIWLFDMILVPVLIM